VAYRVRHTKRNGNIEYKRVDGEQEQVADITPNYQSTLGVICRDAVSKNVAYNFMGGENPSASAREAQIRKDLNRQRKECAETNGMSKGRTMRKVASIPAEYYWQHKIQNGPESLREKNDIKKFCRDNDFLTVPKW